MISRFIALTLLLRAGPLGFILCSIKLDGDSNISHTTRMCRPTSSCCLVEASTTFIFHKAINLCPRGVLPGPRVSDSVIPNPEVVVD
ncbi:hypothetical protein B0J18DRAFT_438235 [Chaetomium sp. MPI-SDFR-AT-0129]|nr:hypothetical protein B0J18DRAFT_438235 [Chaetomium sp. MPI-SDFR-AT-0129]